jgi:transposase
MTIQLTAQEKQMLELRHKTERDGYIRDRIKAVLLRSEDWSLERISQALRLHKDSIRRHLAEYEAENKLSPANGGSEEKLNKSQGEELIAHVEENLYQKASDICAYVLLTYAVSYTVSGMTAWLKHHRFSYKKPKEIPAKADEEKQRAFVAYYEELKAKTPTEEPILFMDSVHPTMETKAASGWIRTGKEKPLLTTASRTRLNLTGAINLATMLTNYGSYETINAVTTIEFLERVKAAYPLSASIHLILDQSGYHRSEAVKNYADNNGFKLHFLPAYSPNLNSIERLWKVMNEYVRNNKFFASAKEFREAIFGFFEKTLPNITKILRSRINDKFHIRVATSI